MIGYLVFGAIGGAAVSLKTLLQDLTAWRVARSNKRLGKDARRFRNFVDPGPDFLVLLTRMVMGALACYLLQDEIKGHFASIAVGASGPAVLGQLWRSRELPEKETT